MCSTATSKTPSKSEAKIQERIQTTTSSRVERPLSPTRCFRFLSFFLFSASVAAASLKQKSSEPNFAPVSNGRLHCPLFSGSPVCSRTTYLFLCWRLRRKRQDLCCPCQASPTSPTTYQARGNPILIYPFGSPISVNCTTGAGFRANVPPFFPSLPWKQFFLQLLKRLMTQ